MDTFLLFEKKYFQESTKTSGNYKAIYECALLQFRNKTYGFQSVKSQKLPCRNNYAV